MRCLRLELDRFGSVHKSHLWKIDSQALSDYDSVNEPLLQSMAGLKFPIMQWLEIYVDIPKLQYLK